jgi:hypothetical protein
MPDGEEDRELCETSTSEEARLASSSESRGAARFEYCMRDIATMYRSGYWSVLMIMLSVYAQTRSDEK